jgi:hypothetical protein
MLWRKSANPPPSAAPLPVPCGEAVRLAALSSSWRRDKRVAQRRLAWRWTLWYLQRYYRHGLGLLVLALAGAYLSGARVPTPAWPQFDVLSRSPAQPEAPAASAPPRSAASVSAPDPVAAAEPYQSPDEPLALRRAWQLAPASGAPIPLPADSGPTDTLSLKPETWLHSKEP